METEPVVLVGQQMEQSFPLEILRRKKNNFRRIPLFSFLAKWPEYHWTICLITLTYHQCSLVRYAAYFPKLAVERTVPFDSPTEQLFSFFFSYKSKTLLVYNVHSRLSWLKMVFLICSFSSHVKSLWWGIRNVSRSHDSCDASVMN